MLTPGKRLTLFSIRKTDAGSIWIRCGVVFVNKDGSLNIRLDALPLDGMLHARDSGAGSTTNTSGSDRPAA